MTGTDPLQLRTEPGTLEQTIGFAPLDSPFSVQARAALRDASEGLRRFPAWRYLASESVRNQYRRTVLGPFWLTLQTSLYVVGLALVFGQLLHAQLRSFLPYVAVGFVTYILLQGVTRAAAQTYLKASSTMKSTLQPLTSLVLRDVAIEFIQFGHNLVPIAALVMFGLITPAWSMLGAIPMALVIALNALALGWWLGPSVARYRDLEPAVLSVLQVLIFFTPVFYRQDALHGVQGAVVAWNPFTYLIQGFRGTLIGGITTTTLVGVAVVTLTNVTVGMVVFARTRSRLPYWVA